MTGKEFVDRLFDLMAVGDATGALAWDRAHRGAVAADLTDEQRGVVLALMEQAELLEEATRCEFRDGQWVSKVETVPMRRAA